MTTTHNTATTTLLTMSCENGDHADCAGWEKIPFGGHLVAACACTGCEHPHAWTQRQAEDRLLAAQHGAYPGETVMLGGPSERVLGTWPGALPRPARWSVIVVYTIRGQRQTADVTVTLTHPTGDYATDQSAALMLAREVGYEVCPSMAGTPCLPTLLREDRRRYGR